MKPRGMTIPAPGWWLERVRAAFAKSDLGLVENGKRLAKAIDRAEPYNHGTLSKLLKEDPAPETTTQELADAISICFDVPRLYHVPRNADEADAMEAIARAYDRVEATDPVRSDRKAQLLRRLEKLERAADGQKQRLDSVDETRRHGDRRRGGLHRGRTSSS